MEQLNPTLPRCLYCFEQLHAAQDGTVYGHIQGCKNEVLFHCSGCVDKNSEGTHAGHTIEHGHVGCEHEEERPFAPPLANEDIESITERIVILYANHSGRDSEGRAPFRNDVRKIIASELSTARAGEKPSMIADLAGLPTGEKAEDMRLFSLELDIYKLCTGKDTLPVEVLVPLRKLLASALRAERERCADVFGKFLNKILNQ